MPGADVELFPTQAANPVHDSNGSYVRGHPVYYPPEPEKPAPWQPSPQPFEQQHMPPTPPTSRRICGCSRKLFIILVVVAAILVVAIALGAGLGVGLSGGSGGGSGSTKLADGKSCSAAQDCINNCINDVCTSKAADKAPCSSDDDCASGTCGVQSNVCLLSAGQPCAAAGYQCASLQCLNLVCA